MRIRIVLPGIAAGVISLIALWLPWYVVYPATFIPEWSAKQLKMMPDWLSFAMLGFSAITIFAFGWVAARWSWAKTWRESLLAGAGVGLIAGCLIYDFLGAFYFGLAGQEAVLKAFYETVTETQGLTLIVDAVGQTGIMVYAFFVFILFGGLLAGALGGLASAMDVEDVWGKPPRKTDGWLFRIPAYTLTLTGVGCMILMIAVLSILEESATNTFIENQLTNISAPPVFMYLAAYAVALVFVLMPIAMTWGWLARCWKFAGYWRILYGVWLLFTFWQAGWMLKGFLNFENFLIILEIHPYFLIWLLVLILLVLGFFAGFGLPMTDPSETTYRLSDWLGYALTQGILGGTQLFMSVVAYSLMLTLILIVNIPHLTQTGTVDSAPLAQVRLLYNMLFTSAAVFILAGMVLAWIFGGIVYGVRKILKVRSVVHKFEAEAISVQN